MLDTAAELFNEIQRFRSTQPTVAGIQADSQMVLVTERIQNRCHPLNRIRHFSVRFDQQFHIQFHGPLQGLIKLFTDRENLLLAI